MGTFKTTETDVLPSFIDQFNFIDQMINKLQIEKMKKIEENRI